MRKKFLLFLLLIFTLSIVQNLVANNIYQNIDLLLQIRSKVLETYVEEIEPSRLDRGAIEGLVVNLDPYNALIRKGIPYPFEGKSDDGRLGIIYGHKDKWITVVSTLENSPARRAGLKGGDTIIKIGKRETRGTSVYDMSQLDWGTSGEKVKLTVIKDENYKELELTYEKFAMETEIEQATAEPGFELIKFTSFKSDWKKELLEKLENLKLKKIKGLVLDLRYNCDGSVEDGVNLADIFIPDGKELGTLKGNSPGKTRLFSSSDGLAFDLGKMAVIIHQDTAGGAEVAAQILKEQKGAKLVGKKSFGMAYASTVFPLDEEYDLLLVTSVFVSKNKVEIHNRGITPDKESPLIEEDKAQAEGGNEGKTIIDILTRPLKGDKKEQYLIDNVVLDAVNFLKSKGID